MISNVDAVELESEVFPVVKIHTFGTILNGGTPSSTDDNWNGDIPFITPPDLNGLEGKEVTSVSRSITNLGLESGSSSVEKGVIISCRAPVGYVGRVTAPSAFNQGCKVILTGQEHRYVAYVLAASQGNLQILANGTTFSEISSTSLANYAVPLPPVDVQQRIADYLDRETTEIDAAVADLDRYVALLELRARTLIKQQLSGDHPQVKMGLLADAIIGITYSPNDVVEEGGTKVYRSGNVQDSRINRQNMLAVNVEIPPHLRFQEDDILMCSRNGSANLVGKNAIVGPEDLRHTWGAFMTVIRSDLNRYLFWFFRSPQFDAYRGLFSTSTINQLTTGILNRIPVPLPPRGRRDEIVKALELEVEQIDALIAESTKLRNLLLKRRSVLITEVVTGRKQV